ncbi:low-density lipoprotein receptor [Plakobranchus ocellatus]|uniref:Low-density lipoprotein receptor n=1 Tax=Plakobranchus ocellatus TaxID=259542 RepID=A0AAV3YTW4_9GAST|nr:low-density lipoprotein receptor [Plakobranchus ocellatus]
MVLKLRTVKVNLLYWLQCSSLEFPICNEIGFNESLLPNNVWNCDDNQCLIETFNNFAQESIQAGCRDLIFFCSYVFHACSYDPDGQLMPVPIRPCKETCSEAVENCDTFMSVKPDCSDLVSIQEENAKCVQEEKAQPEVKCFDQVYPLCKEIGFTSASHNVWFIGNFTEFVEQFETFALPSILSGCWEFVTFYLCGLFFPPCPKPGEPQKLPCKIFCEGYEANCAGYLLLECEKLFSDDQCLHPSDLQDESEGSTATTTPEPTTTTTSTTTPEPRCEKVNFPMCESLGFTNVSFPNVFGDDTLEEANFSYITYAEHAISTGCAKDIAFYMCALLFPPCKQAGHTQRPLPCRSVCDEVNLNCPTQLYTQNCNTFSSSDENSCLKPPQKKACGANEFSCVNTNECVPKDTVCDRHKNCADWSDERNCSCHKTLETKCAMGLCIPSFRKCDGSVQCPDGSDETQCENQCKMGHYKCSETNICIPPEWLCDNHDDCLNKDDEHFCDNCSQGEFACTSDKRCISSGKQCDGTPDCNDKSDEARCVYALDEVSSVYLHVPDHNYPVVCSHGFTEAHALNACLKSGYP